MYHSPYDMDDRADFDRKEATPLPFEAEFDGIRRPVTGPQQPLFDPKRYWDLQSGTD